MSGAGTGKAAWPLADARLVGAGLRRPECVVAHASGLLFAPDWTDPGGVSVIAPSGRVTRILATAPAFDVETPVRANGVALLAGGAFLLAHLGDRRGGVYHLAPDGVCTVVTDRLGRAPMPPTNFVAVDRRRRLWITISTTVQPRAADYRPTARTGVIALHHHGETRVLVEDLGYANECLFCEDSATLYVNETFARRLTAFDVIETGDGFARLARRRTIVSFGAGVFPDGLAQSADGGLFVTSIVSNQVLRIDPETGDIDIVLAEADAAHVAAVEAAFNDRRMGRPHLDATPATRLRQISNLAFGGVDRRTAYLGCLLGDAIVAIDTPVVGRSLAHWRADLGPLATLANG